MNEVKGKFEVEGTPAGSSVATELGLMHMKFEKRFHGPLNATSVVAMMGLINAEIGSGGYVALEKLEGTLESKKGSFYLQHSSFMDRGAQKQSIRVVPDSGTGELARIQGEMIIDLVGEEHFYIFKYEISTA